MSKQRCSWCLSTPSYIQYHDIEWGVVEKQDKKLFEFLILEGMQAGLSWRTVLEKRESMRQAFLDFDANKLALCNDDMVEQWLANSSLIRNRLKLKAVIKNAQAMINICGSHSSFSDFIWKFSDGQTHHNHWQRMEQIPSQTQLSEKLAKALKKEGFKFVGSTIIYAYMQAIGMVNDHLTSCFRYSELCALSRKDDES